VETTLPALVGTGNLGIASSCNYDTGLYEVYGVQAWWYQEPWTEAGGELLDLLLAIAGWVARRKSNRRSVGTKAGLQRAVSHGKR